MLYNIQRGEIMNNQEKFNELRKNMISLSMKNMIFHLMKNI